MSIHLLEHDDFLKHRKQHYKNEFSPAMLLKQGSNVKEEDDEEDAEGREGNQ